MDKVIIDVELPKMPKENDVLVWKKNRFVAVHKNAFLNELETKFLALNERVVELDKQLNNVKLELALNRGEITEEEYLCGLIK